MDEWSREHTTALVEACLQTDLVSEAEASTLLELIDAGSLDVALDILGTKLSPGPF